MRMLTGERDHVGEVSPGESATLTVRERARRHRSAVLPSVVVFVAGLLWFGRQVGRPGVWEDEAATIAVCRRSLAEVFAMSRDVDLVHLAYYLLAKLVWLIDPSATALRWISVVCMALAAGLLVRLGGVLGSPPLGVTAGMFLVVNPFASRYAQEARSFALVTLVATASTLALVQLLRGSRRSAWWYTASVVALGLVNVLAMLLLLAHAAIVLTGRPAGFRSPVRRWGVCVAAALALLAPFVAVAATQRGQVAWIPPPQLYDLRALATLTFGSRLAPLLVAGAVAVVLLAAAIRRGRRVRTGGPPSGARRAALSVGVTWAAIPPAALFAASFVVPMWTAHYVLFALPGTLLALAATVPGIDRPLAGARGAVTGGVAVLAVVALAALGADAQRQVREPETGHSQDLAVTAANLQRWSGPDDAVVYVPADVRLIAEAYPAPLGAVDDVLVAQTPRSARDLVGRSVPVAEVRGRLGDRRVWLVRRHAEVEPELSSLDAVVLRELGRGFRRTHTHQVGDIETTLYLASSRG
jgi:mannosyltransferase